VARAILMIAHRRVKVDDRNREKLPDSPDSDPREVLAYLRRHSGPNIPRWVLQADVCDALTLNNWLWWEDKRTELHWLKAGRDRGLFLTQLGAQLGIGKQGVLDKIDRLEALLRYDRPDEQLARSARRAARAAKERRPAEQAWLDTHREAVMAVIADLVGHAERYDLEEAEREWVDELAIEGRDDDLRPTTMVVLGLACSELRTAPPVLALDSSRPHGVHTALARADGLRSRFAVLA
jgi:hypothetical protein